MYQSEVRARRIEESTAHVCSQRVGTSSMHMIMTGYACTRMLC